MVTLAADASRGAPTPTDTPNSPGTTIGFPSPASGHAPWHACVDLRVMSCNRRLKHLGHAAKEPFALPRLRDQSFHG